MASYGQKLSFVSWLIAEDESTSNFNFWAAYNFL